MERTPPLAPPPRPVPASLRLRVLLGGVLPTIGWFVLTIGGSLATIFVGNSELRAWWRFAGALETTQGVVTARESTQMETNGRAVQLVGFEYHAVGRQLRGISYTVGAAPDVGERVDVEYARGAPEHARIVGMGSAPFPGWVAFTLLFPAAGVALVYFGLRQGRARLRLMRDGQAAWGLLTGTRATSTRINNQTVHVLTFTVIDAAGGQHTVEDRSHRPEYRDDGVAREVLFVPGERRCAVIPLLPGGPRVADGAWRPVGPLTVARVLALPAVALLAISVASSVRF